MKIGVLGGIGPEATAEFYSKLIKALQETGKIKSNKDYPQIIINSIPAPELIHEEITEKELQPYIKGLKELDEVGVDFIIMVCNTIHIFYDELQKKIRTPIIDLRKEVERCLAKHNVKSVLMLGTPMVAKNGLYDFHGIKTIVPTKTELRKISETIFLFNKGVDEEGQAEEVRKIYHRYIKKDAEIVVLACTELALMLKDEKMKKINTIDIMVAATINGFNIAKQYNLNCS